MAGALTKQELFSAAMLAFMTELKGGKLKKFCETMTQAGGEMATFNRLSKSSAVAGVASMFDTAHTNANGGDMTAHKATIGYVSAQMKIKEEEMNKTNIDIKNSYVKSLGNAVSRKEDSAIIAGLMAGAPTDVTVTGMVGYDTEAAAKAVIMTIRKAQALAEETIDGYNGVALVMSPTDWSELSSSEYVLNQDYNSAFGTSPDGKVKTFFGAEVILMDDTAVGSATSKECYVIPSNVVCFAEWEGSQRGDAVFVPTDGLRWHLQAVKSIGVVAAEPKSAFRIKK